MKTTTIEKIPFNDLITSFKIEQKDAFLHYLTEIWNDLTRRSSKDMEGINSLVFAKYYDLPGIISDRLFAVFNINKKPLLSMHDFLMGMTSLFSNDFTDLAKFIFNFYDFDKDRYITREDVRVVLSYVPVKSRLSNKEYLKYEVEDFIDRVEAQDELFALLNKTFDYQERLSEQDFIKVIYNKCSDAFVFILIFLLENRPFTKQTIQVYQQHFAYKLSQSTLKKNIIEEHIIMSPSNMIKLNSPSLKHQQELFKEKRFSIKENNNRTKVISLFRNKSPLVINKRNTIDISTNHDDNLPNPNIKSIPKSPLLEREKKTYHPHRRNKQLDFLNSFSPFNKRIEEPLLTEMNITTDDVSDERLSTYNTEDTSDELSNDIYYVGYTYKLGNNNKLKRLWLKLVHKDLYIFKEKDDMNHKGLHNLTGVYINGDPPLTYGAKTYFSFTLIYPNKTRTYYIDTEPDFRNWLKYLRKASNVEPLFESYEIMEIIGKGKFGLVKLGIHKKTQRKVAIKIMNKKDMTPEDFQLAKTEIDILKISQHPNIIKLYDVIESPEAIYIIMEYCAGGDLFAYIEKRNYKLTEKKSAEIIHKLATVIFFIHSYGIVHRDLKPENILMTDDSDTADIRLLDFGLSKILGPNETCKEPYGTMSYVAPEVLLEKPYNQKVDLWSIGVITYLLLSGCLPFDDENSEKEIARQTILDPVPFHHKLWKYISLDAKSFVNSLLQKNPRKRMTIKQLLEHEWINKYYTKVTEERRNSIDLASSIFKLYSSVQM